MGIQIYIKVADLAKCDCAIEFSAVPDEDGDVWHRAQVTLNETGQVFYMDTDAKRELLCNEYNEWGSNKAVIEPKVKKLGVKFILS